MLIALAPGVFVLLWSTGFISAKYGLPYADPAIFLAIRFALTAVLLSMLVVALKRRWPREPAFYLHQSVVGILMHCGYLGGVFTGIWLGVTAGTSALIVGLQPVLTAFLAGLWLREPLTLTQWSGLVLGFAGVVMVVADRQAGISADTGGWFGLGLCVIALVSISVGTVYQKRHGSGRDLLAGSTIQFAAATALMTILAPTYGSLQVIWSSEFILTLTWLILVLSVCAILLLMWLINHGAAAQVASLFYLVPPVVAVEAYLLFGEKLGVQAIIGLVLVMLAVWLVRR